MDSEVNLYLLRAEDEFLLARNDMRISLEQETKEYLGIQKNKTFFHSVINHAYYSIFYATKAYLYIKGIITTIPDEHLKTYNELKRLAINGIIDKELIRIYETEIIKADSLLKIFKLEKGKRGKFVYNVKSEANLPFAEESINNAKKFISTIKLLINKGE